MITESRKSRIVAMTVWLALAFAMMPVAAVRAQQSGVDAARKEGRVVVYGTIVPKVMSLIEKGFQETYGIKTEYWRGDATKVIDRVLTEWRAGKPGFDVVIGARGPISLGKPDKVFAQYTPAAAAAFPAKFKDPDGQLTAWRITPVGVLYNTELVKSSEAPKSFDDLLDPKWQGRITMPDPSRHASTAQMLANLEQIKGKNWMEFVRALAKQKPLLVQSYSTVPVTIVRGEAALGISYVQYVGQTKGPIDFAPIGQYFADPSDAALGAKAANVNAGKLFIDYLCSPEGQKKVAATGEFVLSPGIYPAVTGADKLFASLFLMNDLSEQRLKALQGQLRDWFLAK